MEIKQKASPHSIWLKQPAEQWVDAFPIGNGSIGGTVFCRTGKERIALNHENLWRDKMRAEPEAFGFPARHKHLREIRNLFFKRQWVEATRLTNQLLSGGKKVIQPYQPFGDLNLLIGHEKVEAYRRTLHLDTGIAEVVYQYRGAGFRRECFVSAEDNVIVLRLKANRPGGITAEAFLGRIEDPECLLSCWTSGQTMGFTGIFNEGIKFAAEARLFQEGGRISDDVFPKLKAEGVDQLLILLAMATDYNQPEPALWCERHLDGIRPDFEYLKQRHTAEHSDLFNRVSLDLGSNPEAEKKPTDERLKKLKEGNRDPGLYTLFFHAGRYILMSCSRRCEQPANLFGIWSGKLQPPWDSDFHHDINIQQCYWPAEVCNLAECAEPLFHYLRRIMPEGRRGARDIFGCRGIYIPMATDIWARVAPGRNRGWGGWTGAAAWLSEHLWWRYEYGRDKDFLRNRAYPFLKLAADFYEDFLVRDDKGRLVTVPSQSPENWFVGGPQPVSLTISATMDLLLIREVLGRCIEASKILGVDENMRPRWERILEDIPPFQVGRHGQLQEWLEDFEEGDPGHRHLSHLLGVFPGELMTWEKTPRLMEAAKVSLERRLAAEGGESGMQYAWACAWAVGLWARFRDGNRAYSSLEDLLCNFVSQPLFGIARNFSPEKISWFPAEMGILVEGNLGGAAVIAEMLLQSHGGIIRLLPALPEEWPEGQATGLRARGGFEVHIKWSGGKLEEARITSLAGLPCRLALPWENWQVLREGKRCAAMADNTSSLSWPTEAGGCYSVLRC